MFTLRQLLKEIKTGCTNPIGHVREMRTYAMNNPTIASACRVVECPGCDITMRAERQRS